MKNDKILRREIALEKMIAYILKNQELSSKNHQKKLKLINL